MQVKKYEASTVIEALKQVKKELGPDAIILSTQEAKRPVTGVKKFIVVAAVSETQLKKKALAEKKLGSVFKEKVESQSANKQKMFIENVYRGAEKKYQEKNRSITQTRYIDIDDQGGEATSPVTPTKPTASEPSPSQVRVKQAAREAFKSSLGSDFFGRVQVEDETQVDPRTLKTRRGPSPEEAPQSEALVQMLNRLQTSGVSEELCRQWAEKARRELGGQIGRKALVDSWFAKCVLSHVTVVERGGDPRVEVFVGPHGSGKTTTLVKLATQAVVQENRRVAIVTSDLHKVGGVEQLRVYSRILNTPVFVVRDPSLIAEKINELHEFDKILVDTPGISLSNIEELDFMRAVAQLNSREGHRVHLVLSALTKEHDLGGILKRFRVAQFADIIVTNIDQTSQHGILLNIQSKIDKPYHSFGIGSDVVDGFESASRERVLDLIFKLTKQIGEKGNDNRI